MSCEVRPICGFQLESADLASFALWVRRTLGWMCQPTGLHHVHSSSLGPLVDSLPVHTFMSCGICDGYQTGWRPLKSDQTDIAVTHRCLSKEVKTVLCIRLVSSGHPWAQQGMIRTIVKTINLSLLISQVFPVMFLVAVLVKPFLLEVSTHNHSQRMPTLTIQ